MTTLSIDCLNPALRTFTVLRTVGLYSPLLGIVFFLMQCGMTSDSKCLLSPEAPPCFCSIDRCLNGNNCCLLLNIFTPVAHSISGCNAMWHDLGQQHVCFRFTFGLCFRLAFCLLLAFAFSLLLACFWIAFGSSGMVFEWQQLPFAVDYIHPCYA